jgi:hypothetical protein
MQIAGQRGVARQRQPASIAIARRNPMRPFALPLKIVQSRIALRERALFETVGCIGAPVTRRVSCDLVMLLVRNRSFASLVGDAVGTGSHKRAWGPTTPQGAALMMKTLLISATVLALAAPALAQVPSDSRTNSPPTSSSTTAAPDEKIDFSKVDSDKSGALSLAEIKMVDVSATQADFDKYDANKDKQLSSAEFDKWQAAHNKVGKAG